jgi:uncharacterized membrane protein
MTGKSTMCKIGVTSYYLKNGKKGFALTRTGVYCKSMGSPRIHTTWKELVNGHIVIHKKDYSEI